MPHSDLREAVIRLLMAIDRAGGWHVFDPVHQDRIASAMAAVEATIFEQEVK